MWSVWIFGLSCLTFKYDRGIYKYWIRLKIGLNFFTKHNKQTKFNYANKLSVLSLNKVGRKFVLICIFIYVEVNIIYIIY